MSDFGIMTAMVVTVVPIGSIIAIEFARHGMKRSYKIALVAIVAVSVLSATMGSWHGFTFEEGEAAMSTWLFGWFGIFFSLVVAFFAFAASARHDQRHHAEQNLRSEEGKG